MSLPNVNKIMNYLLCMKFQSGIGIRIMQFTVISVKLETFKKKVGIDVMNIVIIIFVMNAFLQDSMVTQIIATSSTF